MTSSKEQEILQALRRVRDPDLGKDIVELGFIKNLAINRETVSLAIELTTPACPVKDKLKEEARVAVLSVPGIKDAKIEMTARVRPSLSEQKDRLLPGVKNTISIASGKGGVGKSTVSANLAVALAKLGAKVGLLDADVYGPSIPRMMGIKEMPEILPGNRVVPVVAFGVRVMSMGFFLKEGEAIIWRGPMLHKTIQQFLGDVEWGELDYLVLDLPPGTGDIQLSICQTIPLTGAAIVSTPQEVALKVAEKAILMFNKLNTPVLGIIENMSGFICSHCGKTSDVFGSDGVKNYSLSKNLPFLGRIPLDQNICQASDSGTPLVVSAPESPSGKAFFQMAQNLAAQVSIRNMSNSDGKLIPKAISPMGNKEVSLLWNDGHQSNYSVHSLRLSCLCAGCVDEMSGKPLLNSAKVPSEIILTSAAPVGQYALRFYFGDGHSSGIYTFEYLRSLCPCPECQARRAVKV